MAPRRTARPVWAAALALLSGCSPEKAEIPVEPAPEEVSFESERVGDQPVLVMDGEGSFSPGVFQLGAEELRALSREKIWARGVERLGWHPQDPPEEWTKEMMVERFSIDAQYEGWFDGVGYGGLRERGYGGDE